MLFPDPEALGIPTIHSIDKGQHNLFDIQFPSNFYIYTALISSADQTKPPIYVYLLTFPPPPSPPNPTPNRKHDRIAAPT